MKRVVGDSACSPGWLLAQPDSWLPTATELKHLTAEEDKAASLRAEQQVLGHVAQEMQEARYRAFSERREQEAA